MRSFSVWLSSRTGVMWTRHNRSRPPTPGARLGTIRGILVAFATATVAMALAADTNIPNKEIQLPPLTGTFVSKRPPIYTLQLNTNGTYELLCTVPRYGTDINGNPHTTYTYPGLDSGTWRWRPETGEYSLTSTNRRTDFPLKTLRYHARDTNRLEAVNALLLRDPWLIRKKDP